MRLHTRSVCFRTCLRRWSIPQRQRHPNRHKHPTTNLIETSSDATQPRADAVGYANNEQFCGDLDGGERARHDDELQEQAAMRVEELRQERGEEEDRFGVGDLCRAGHARRGHRHAEKACRGQNFR